MTSATRIGARFDLKDFHAVVIDNGPMPLAVFESSSTNGSPNVENGSRPIARCIPGSAVGFISLEK